MLPLKVTATRSIAEDQHVHIELVIKTLEPAKVVVDMPLISGHYSEANLRRKLARFRRLSTGAHAGPGAVLGDHRHADGYREKNARHGD